MLVDVAAKVTSKGQVTVPKAVRDALGIEAGDVVIFDGGDVAYPDEALETGQEQMGVRTGEALAAEGNLLTVVLLPLLVDLYELTMAAGYVRVGVAQQTATFDLFVRRLPEPG